MMNMSMVRSALGDLPFAEVSFDDGLFRIDVRCVPRSRGFRRRLRNAQEKLDKEIGGCSYEIIDSSEDEN
jgi:hypothetical protein